MKFFYSLLLISVIACNDAESVKPIIHINKDSLISAIKKDSLYKVLKVEITPDSTIKINVKDPEEAGTDNYFDKAYNLLSGGYIQEIAIYKNKQLMYSEGMHTNKIVAEFKERNMSGNECTPVNEEIKKRLNDPSSFEHVETKYIYMADLGSFRVQTIFRAKNAFNATMTNKANAILLPSGVIISLKIND